ncbi:MAG TPA: hypothetical protein VGG78_05945 [Gemmatimonadaceae bacterium]
MTDDTPPFSHGHSAGTGPTEPTPASESCDLCGSTDLVWRNCKLLCRNCHAIVKSCADL